MIVNNTREILDNLATELGKLYADLNEGKAVAEILLAEILNTTRAKLYLSQNVISDSNVLNKIENAVYRLMKNEPIQYVIGKSWFYNMELFVSKNVLIPRPETEELVLWVKEKCQGEKNISFVDIGTGSGCIALSLKKIFPNSNVYGIDFSENALEVAKKNAQINKIDVNWILQDVLEDNNKKNFFDENLVVVSNPPYILESEKKNIAKRVVNYEPHAALFVPDSNPLIFYEKIINEYLSFVKNFFFEINPLTFSFFEKICAEKDLKLYVKNDFRNIKRMIFIEK